MKYRILIIIFFGFMFNLYSQTVIKPSGKGTINEPFLISSWENLCWMNSRDYVDGVTFKDKMSKHYVQIADISFPENIKDWDNGQGWMPIGHHNNYKQFYSFEGSYDGKGHTISNLYINRPDLRSVGLFSRLLTNYESDSCKVIIQGLGLVNVNITGEDEVGALAGNSGTAFINKCYAIGKISSLGYAGGLIGVVGDGMLLNYSNQTEVRGLISNCYFKGTVTGIEAVGGITATVVKTTISNCYSMADLSCDKGSVGGIFGFIYSIDNYLTNSYFKGTLKGNSNVDMFLEYDKNLTISNVFWDMESSPLFINRSTLLYKSVKISNTKGLTTQEMKSNLTFIKAGWDFKNIWQINKSINEGYPSFKWQK